MFEYIREQFSYNVEWRYRRNLFIRFFSMVLLLSLFSSHLIECGEK